MKQREFKPKTKLQVDLEDFFGFLLFAAFYLVGRWNL